MKQFSLLFLLFLMMAGAAKASTVSGTISYSGSAGAAAGVKVYLYDSSMSAAAHAIDSAITSGTGGYGMTATSVTGHIYYLRCNACPSASFYYLGSFGSSMTANFSLSCNSVTVIDTVRNSTTGTIVWGQKVYIINATTTYIDSAYTNSSGVATFGVPLSVASGTFTVSTYACGLQSQAFTYSGTAMVAPTLMVCVSNPVISGTLTNVSASAPIAYHAVYLVDSSSTTRLYYDSTYTNASGAYSFTLAPSMPSGNMIAYAYTCGARIRNSAAFSGSNLTLNLSGCATSIATVSGTVTNAVTSVAVAGQKVYLMDSTWTFVYRDSTVTNASGGYSFTLPANVTSANVTVSTASCGVQQYQYAYYTGRSIVVNFGVYSGPTRTYAGTVYFANGLPAAGALVWISSGGATLSLYASSTGTYSFTLPCNWPTTGTSNWYGGGITPCGKSRTFPNSSSSITGVIDTLCYNGVSGTVRKQGGGVASNAKVYFIQETVDTSTTPYTYLLNVLDSAITNASGAYVLNGNVYTFGPIHVAFYVKAALQPSDPAYSNFLPTYHDSSLVWSGADTVTYTMWSGHATGVDISLRGGTNPGGPGFIGGNVLLGANKSAAVGDPLAQRVLLLTDASDKAIAYTYSDAAGKFSFSNLPLGSYKIFGDAWGRTNPPLVVTLSSSNTAVNNIIFEENSTTFVGQLKTLGVNGPSVLDAVRMYPNPVKDKLSVTGMGSIKGDKTAVLRDVTGVVVCQTKLSGNDGVIATGKLASGIYLLQLQTESGVVNFRFVKE